MYISVSQCSVPDLVLRGLHTKSRCQITVFLFIQIDEKCITLNFYGPRGFVANILSWTCVLNFKSIRLRV